VYTPPKVATTPPMMTPAVATEGIKGAVIETIANPTPVITTPPMVFKEDGMAS
jgi:hypothetical protein